MSGSNEKSIYKPLGMNAHAFQAKKKSVKIPPIYSGDNDKAVVHWGHQWSIEVRSGRRGICKNCHQPRFIVDGTKCAGKP